MPDTRLGLDEAVELTRTGDLWLFRGRSAADRAIRVTTNSPVNHVGMAVVIEDLPPMMWHAELGRSLPDLWTGGHQRGVQLHDLRAAVLVWATRYGQQAWLRQLDPPISRAQEDEVLRTVARLDGTPFPSTARLASRWVRGRVPRLRGQLHPLRGRAPRLRDRAPRLVGRKPAGDQPPAPQDGSDRGHPPGLEPGLASAYCAEVVAVTYQAMGLLPAGIHQPHWYDPGRFWSGDELRLRSGARLGGEIAVQIPAGAGRPTGEG